MNIKSISDKVNAIPDEKETSLLKEETKRIIELLKGEISKQKTGADVFIGGSFAKGTLVKKKEYDIDIFIRFDWRYENLTRELEKIVKNVARKMRLPYTTMHGSR